MLDRPRRPLPTLLIVSTLLLGPAGCDLIQQKLGLEDPAAKAARLEAEGRAVGGGCRQSGRAIEDCYSIYSWLQKAAIYEGWRDMDAYMRENKLETVEPQLPPPQAPNARKRRSAPTTTDATPNPATDARDGSHADGKGER
ncbi:hypothetical protein [Accumulibacter sp.]|uniref:hypothetical protein n=1 Tax=Accumulibacter sp. TaxID=2053492 RepID=UPI00260406D6|nr:hypothetical protein [Accumulibacter sp.]